MKNIKYIVLTIITSVLFTSCGSATRMSVNELNGNIAYLDVVINEVISPKEAIACTPEGKVIKLVTNKEVYFVGKRIEGRCILVGTETVNFKQTHVGINAHIGETEQQLTIPVFKKETELIESVNMLPSGYGRSFY